MTERFPTECRITGAPTGFDSDPGGRSGTRRHRWWANRLRLVVACAWSGAIAITACVPLDERLTEELARERTAVLAALDQEVARIRARGAAIDSVFQPLPLLSPSEEAALRRSTNSAHLERARALGITPGLGTGELQRLEREGRLVRLADSTEHWIVRRLDYSVPLVVPAAAALLEEIAERFQRRLIALGSPAFRVEVTSVLRSAEDQARLRQVNSNAAAGTSAHEFGTTFDLAYNAYAPPARPIVEFQAPEAAWLGPHLRRLVDLEAEVIAARRARELQAILGQVLIELQNEGRVLVTLEQLQPVFHLTVGAAP